MFTTLADAAGTSEKVIIYTLIGGHVVTLVTLAIKAVIDQANRVQDRLDAESKAKILLAEGAERERRINAKIDENTAMNAELLSIIRAGKGFFKVTGWIATAVKWTIGLALPIIGLWLTIKNGK